MMWKKWHRIVALMITIPLILIVASGLILQLRNQFESIQPKALSSTLEPNFPLLSLDQVIGSLGGKNIDQIIYRPSKGNLSIRMKDGMDIQIHPQTGEILKRAPRRTNFLIDLHQGTWIGSFGQYFIYLPASVGLAFLIVSGIAIYPFKKRKFL
jgi:uncharacterized iron-regulated membrane protein